MNIHYNLKIKQGNLVLEENVDFIVGIKAGVFASDCEVVARSLIGDHLSKTGEYDVSQHFTLTPGDIVWGCFATSSCG